MKSKTNLGGLISSIGLALSGGGILAQLTQMFPGVIAIPNSVLLTCWFIALLGIILKIVGVCMVAYYAADDTDLQAVKKIVNSDPIAPTDTPADKTLTPPTPKTP